MYDLQSLVDCDPIRSPAPEAIHEERPWIEIVPCPWIEDAPGSRLYQGCGSNSEELIRLSNLDVSAQR